MNWRCRTVNDDLKVEKNTIYKFYKEQYKNDLFYINRKYQRKLVWTLDEKKKLIDTIFRKYPIPMFLIATYIEPDTSNNEIRWEIIDGLQRIDAIISFINGEFPTNYNGEFGYFNLDAFTGYGKKISDGTIKQSSPTLPLELCEKFLDYELSFSVTGKEDSEVEEIFRRINSTGRKLSKQDLRQAGVTGKFSDLVRKTATYIRGDYTDKDLLKLTEISDYSLNNKDLPYGIDIEDIFWIKQNIIPEDGIRRSKDEEIIAHLYIYLLTKGEYPSSYVSLEKAYDDSKGLKHLLDNEIDNDENFICWMELFAKVISMLNNAFNNKTFSEILFGRNNVYNKDNAFIVLFCAMTNLILDGMVLSDQKLFHKTLHQLGNNELSEITSASDSKWNKDIRNRLIKRIQNVIKSSFSYVPKEQIKNDEWDVKMVNLLERAEAEEQMYDFKAGITDYNLGVFNKKIIQKIVQTLTAMVNTKPSKEGYIVIGIPNDDENADTITKILNTKVATCKNYKIIGVKDEANKYYKNVDNYLRIIKDAIEKEPVSDAFKNEILTRSHLVEYKGKLLLMFVCQSLEPVYYDKNLYVRYESHNHLVEPGDELNLVMKRFYQK